MFNVRFFRRWLGGRSIQSYRTNKKEASADIPTTCEPKILPDSQVKIANYLPHYSIVLNKLLQITEML